jgi:hypothetical protein
MKIFSNNIHYDSNDYIYLNINFNEKDTYKKYGIKWNSKEKMWYITDDIIYKTYEWYFNRFSNLIKSNIEKYYIYVEKAKKQYYNNMIQNLYNSIKELKEELEISDENDKSRINKTINKIQHDISIYETNQDLSLLLCDAFNELKRT